MKQWITDYVQAHKAALDSIPAAKLAELIGLLRQALLEKRHIFIFGNGGSAANASHFATDLGKGASDKVGRRFRCMSLNDNVMWMTALANDYSYDDIFVRQLENFSESRDLVLALSVSGRSPNVVKAVQWANEHGLETIALVGGQRGPLAQLARHVVVIDSTHFGVVEDSHMAICHMLCYAFMENPQWAKA